jgi:hypothetical protein
MPKGIAILADGTFRPLEPKVVDELLSRLNKMGIERRNIETGEVIEQSASKATASRLEAALAAGEERFTATEEQKGSIAWALWAWLNEVGIDDFPESALALRYALAAEQKA